MKAGQGKRKCALWANHCTPWKHFCPLEEAYKSVRTKIDLCSEWLWIFSMYMHLKSVVSLLWVGVDQSLWLKTVVLVMLIELVSYWELIILLVSSDFTGNSAIVEVMHLQKKFAISIGIQCDPTDCGLHLAGEEITCYCLYYFYIALRIDSL